jgi:hypothetical protein
LISSASARARVRTAESVRPRTAITGEVLPAEFPSVAEALGRGDIGVDTATAIVAALAPIRRRVGASEDMDAAEAALVASARGSDDSLPAPPDELRIMAQTWALYLDPDGSLPDEQRGMRKRGLTLGREREGVVPLRGELVPEAAAQLQRLFDAFLNPKVHDAPGPRFMDTDPPAAGKDVEAKTDDPCADETGSDLDGPLPDPRTSAQRRHDAFAGILQVAAGLDGMPQLGGAPPTLVVTVAADQLSRTNGAAFFPSRGHDTGAVSASVARHMGCLANIQRLLLDAEGCIVELGTSQRIFNAHQRRATAVRDGECIIPGCHVPAAWCEMHHVEEASRGGPTHTDNGALLCWFHHRTLESSGWKIRMIRGVPWVRAPRWIDPSGRWRSTAGSSSRRLSAHAGSRTGPPT